MLIYIFFFFCRSRLLKKTLTLVSQGEDGIFPDLKEEIIFFEVDSLLNTVTKNDLQLPGQSVPITTYVVS